MVCHCPISGENGEVIYSIIDGDMEGQFYIDENTGVINTAADLDREVTPGYTLVVMATDKAVEVDNRRSATAEVRKLVHTKTRTKPMPSYEN